MASFTAPTNANIDAATATVASVQLRNESALDLNALALNACGSAYAYAFATGPVQASAPEGICVRTMKRTWTAKTIFGTHRQRPKESAL